MVRDAHAAVTSGSQQRTVHRVEQSDLSYFWPQIAVCSQLISGQNSMSAPTHPRGRMPMRRRALSHDRRTPTRNRLPLQQLQAAYRRALWHGRVFPRCRGAIQ